ncbi:MAG: type IV pilus assembly protein PilM [Lentisphaerae bacterium]|nr:type IV pilus assembly protein PilM [Lentisphaerota bacterium]
MFSSNRILALNVGASKIMLAEFSVSGGRPPTLLNYGTAELGTGADGDGSASSAFLVAALKDVMINTGIRPAPLLMSISGQVVFPRFIKLPPVAKEKLQQMIQYEAEQNVPFPIADLVWDYQLIGDATEGEQNAMIVAAKNDNIAEVASAVAAAGLEPVLIDVAPMALYNCVRYNYNDIDGCALLIDIGARSTNLVFMEEGKFFSRCIPVAGNAITQELAKSFQTDFRAAEALKQECAFVALGGVYAAIGDERADRASKTVRNVVTRLHAEISRSINFYRSQQDGSVPTRVFLTGGSGVIPHMDTFFSDKLQAPTEYLNPFRTVPVGPKIDYEQVGRDAFMLGEVVGLALRRGLSCPLEISLLPAALARRQTFRKRIPYFVLAAAGLMMTAGIWTLYTRQTLRLFERQTDGVKERLAVLQRDKQVLATAQRRFKESEASADEMRQRIASRTQAVRIVDAIRECLYPGMWVTAIEPLGESADGMERVKITGCGWIDRLSELEAANQNRATAVEMLRDQLKQRRVFQAEIVSQDGSKRDGVRIEREREEADGAIRGFVIEAQLAPIT